MELEYMMGRLEKAADTLKEAIGEETLARKNLLMKLDEVNKRLSEGDRSFDRLRLVQRITIAWLILLTAVVFPATAEAVGHFFKALF